MSDYYEYFEDYLKLERVVKDFLEDLCERKGITKLSDIKCDYIRDMAQEIDFTFPTPKKQIVFPAALREIINGKVPEVLHVAIINERPDENLKNVYALDFPEISKYYPVLILEVFIEGTSLIGKHNLIFTIKEQYGKHYGYNDKEFNERLMDYILFYNAQTGVPYFCTKNYTKMALSIDDQLTLDIDEILTLELV